MSNQPSVPPTTAPQPNDTQSPSPAEPVSQPTSQTSETSPHPPAMSDRLPSVMLTPFVEKDVVPHVYGQPQAYFASSRNGPMRVLECQWYITALRQSLALAQRLMLYQLSKADLPEKVIHYLKWLCRSDIWTIGIDSAWISHSYQVPQAGRVAYEQRNRIYINFYYLRFGANTAFIVNSDNNHKNAMSYKRHMLLLAITIGHCLHYSLVRTWWERQDAKDGIETVRNLDWEYSVFGGHVVFYSDEGTFSTAIQGMEGQARHFVMSDDDIKAIVDGEDDWQDRLPLKPTSPWIDGRPPNACFRAGEFYKLGDWYDSSKGEFEVLNMAIIPTSPGHCRLGQ